MFVETEVAGARKRAGRLGNGWYPVAANPRIPLEAERAGRDPSQIAGAILAINCRIGASSKVAMVFDLRSRAVPKQSLMISAAFRNVGCSIVAATEKIFKALLTYLSTSPPK